MLPQQFIAKWKNGGDERRDAQPFFEDICRLIGHGTPRELDPTHEWFTYEYGATKTGGGNGWADVWKKGYFGWEAKGTHKNLEAAYDQLKKYAEALENPPLLVVCDLQTVIVHTNFTSTVKKEYKFTVDQLDQPEPLRILRAVFFDPESLRPGVTRAAMTTEAAEGFAELADRLRNRGHEPHAVAHFLTRLVFCMFAEDIRMLPENVFTRMVAKSVTDPSLFEARSRMLFQAMSKGGEFILEDIAHFNGGLFDDDSTIALEREELKILESCCHLDWSAIEPSIFGTLFERGLDPSKRGQLGAHYTDPETIKKLIEPVVIAPLEREWESEKAAITAQLAKATKTFSEAATKKYTTFLKRLSEFIVLDPACGSGNFLYLSLRALKDFEKKVMQEAELLGFGMQISGVNVNNVRGIEISPYAAELARITIWIGEIQWMHDNGFKIERRPILQSLDVIENRDALLNKDGTRAAWPYADAIVGNPPFIGSRKQTEKLGADYLKVLRKAYAGLVPPAADFVIYWFWKAHQIMERRPEVLAGFVATQAVRAGKSRVVLMDIVNNSAIFNAWSDEPWVNEGASLRVSIIAFGKQSGPSILDGHEVASITADLKDSGRGFDNTKNKLLKANKRVAFQGLIPRGSFVVPEELATEWVSLPTNPNGERNEAVLRPYLNANDIIKRSKRNWVLDFGNMTLEQAQLFEAPFAYAQSKIYPERQKTNQQKSRDLWWQHWCPRPEMMAAMEGLSRYLVTPRVAKHRIFQWVDAATRPDSRLFAIAREDDTTFGILQSKVHQVWAISTSSRHGVGNDPTYNAESVFETFPFPDGLTPDINAAIYAGDERSKRIAEAAVALQTAREAWLHPPEWVESVAEIVSGYPDRKVPHKASEGKIKKRTLTQLYNENPAWLSHLHANLDEAVAAAYGWEWPLSDDEILKRLFALNQERAAKQ